MPKRPLKDYQSNSSGMVSKVKQYGARQSPPGTVPKSRRSLRVTTPSKPTRGDWLCRVCGNTPYAVKPICCRSGCRLTRSVEFTSGCRVAHLDGVTATQHIFSRRSDLLRERRWYGELFGLDGRGGPPTTRRMAAPAVETKRLRKVQRPPDAGPVSARKQCHPSAKAIYRIMNPSQLGPAKAVLRTHQNSNHQPFLHVPLARSGLKGQRPVSHSISGWKTESHLFPSYGEPFE
jgi:hypothetical protein